MNELLEDHDMITIEDIIVHPEIAEHIICSFMAILEATKWKMIFISQAEPFGQIYIYKRPEDWDPDMVDEYDKQSDAEIERIEREKEIEEEKGEAMYYEDDDDEEDEENEDVFIGDEEEIDLDDDGEDEDG